MIRVLVRATTQWPAALLAALALVTLAALVPIGTEGLKQDFNPHLLGPEHPSRLAYERVRAEFTGSGEAVLVHLRHPRTIFNADSLRRLLALTEAFETVTLLPAPAEESALRELLPTLGPDLRARVEALLAGGITAADRDAVLALQAELAFATAPAPQALEDALGTLALRLNPVRKVTSLANVKNILAQDDQLRIHRVYDRVPATGAEVERLRAEVMGNALFRDVLVSEDGRSAGIVVETALPPEDTDLMYALYERISTIVAATPGSEETGVAGIPAAVAIGRSFMERDTRIQFPVVVLLVLATLYLTFRTLSGLLLPLMVVVIAIVWTLGLMALLHVPLNLITNALPVFLITIGVADGVHMISEFKRGLAEGRSRREAVAHMLRHMALPVVMTSVTTTVGFLAVAYSEIRYVQQFGVLVAVGVIVAMGASLLFIPAALALGRAPRRPGASASGSPGGARGGRLSTGLGRLNRFVNRRHRPVLVAFVALGALAVFGTLRMVVDSNVIAYFQDDVPIVQASRSLDAHMAGSTSLYLLVDAPPGLDEPFKEPELLAGVAGLQRHLELYFPYVGRTLSLADLIRRMNLVMHNEDPRYDRLPRGTEWVPVRTAGPGRDAGGLHEPVSGRDLVSQYLLLYEAGGGDLLSDLTGPDYRSLRIALTLTTSSSPAIREMTHEAQRYVDAHFPPGSRARFAGWGELNVSMTNEIVNGQVASLVLSVIAVFVVLLLQFRSVVRAALAIVPLLFTILFNFGVMGWSGVPLDIGTALVAAIAIGIGIDFAIHYLARLDSELRDGASAEQALGATMGASGRAIAANAIVVATGFLALTVSEFNPIRQIGWLVSQTLIVSAIATLVLLPAMIVFLRPAFVFGAAGRAGRAPEPAPDAPHSVRGEACT